MIFPETKEKKARGLSSKEALESREKYGSNIITEIKKKGFWKHLLSNLNDPIIRILIGALLVNLIFIFRTSDWIETAGIAISILLSAFISTISERGSETAFSRLNAENENYFCRVVRDGEVHNLPISEIVCGDLVKISAGDKIPADGHIISGKLSVDQSAMTGESAEIEKAPSKEFRIHPSCPSALLRGCTVISGECEMIVDAVGNKTFIGEISNEIQTDTRESPLKLRLSKLARQISVLGYMAAISVALIYIFNAVILDSAFNQSIILLKLRDWRFILKTLLNAFTFGLTVLVTTVPEGLPLMVSVVLSSNIKSMIKDNVLVKKPVGIEAAGSMNILFTDKTGTITEGRLSVSYLFTDRFDFSGVSDLKMRAPTLYNGFKLNAIYNSSAEIVNGRPIGGNSTESALISALTANETGEKYFVKSKTPFDSARKYSDATINHPQTPYLCKGAPELLLPRIKYSLDLEGNKTTFNASALQAKLSKFTSSGERVILLAVGNKHGKECDLTLICGAVISDRIRLEARTSVESLTQAGIRVVLVTGDSKETATAIASKCGIIRKSCDLVLTSEELSKLNDEELSKTLPNLAVVARALPKDKSRLVRVAQGLGLVCGMTGDGINDAPALKCADVGFSMGGGTQVAKEAGDIVILDNNLASIVKAVLYGRTIFKSIRKFIVLQLTLNLCALGVTMLCPFLGIDSPITLVQLLWLNIIMDTLGGLAFAGEPPLKSYMKEPPKKRDEAILNPYMINQMAILSLSIITLSIFFLKNSFFTSNFRSGENDIFLLTGFFAFFIFIAVFSCFTVRSDRINIFSGILKNKSFILIMTLISIIQIVFLYLGGDALRTIPLSFSELKFSVCTALAVFPIDFARKVIWKHFFSKSGY